MGDGKTKTQVSAGGVAFRVRDQETQIALISVGEDRRWQLPKGRVDGQETNEAAAMREVREETGLETEMINPIEKISYWFYVGPPTQRRRVHKLVYFFLLRYISGNTDDHDHEVNEARWVEINQALNMLTFASEKDIVQKAQQMIRQLA